MTTVTLTTSVLTHLRYTADATAPHHDLDTAAVVWAAWRKTNQSTLHAAPATLEWLEQELRYLSWQMHNRRLLPTQTGFAACQVDQGLAAVVAARRAHSAPAAA